MGPFGRMGGRGVVSLSNWSLVVLIFYIKSVYTKLLCR
jgi:hypothetical protein